VTPAATLGLYAGALALVFGAAVGVGAAVGPVGTAAAGTSSTVPHDDEHAAPAASSARASAPADLTPGGLAVAADGYALELASTTHPVGAPDPLRFVLTGPDGQPLTELTPTHEKDLHLVVVRRDLTGYQHLHPSRDAQGTWSVPLTLAEPGPYKVFADFTPAGRDRGLTLAADLTAPGTHVPEPLPPPATATSVDGYDVSLDGRLVAGTSSPLTLTVQRDGRPVTDLEPYLGAYGHLVALREGDLAYLHVHPDGEATAGPDIAFSADVPSAATYRLFLDFSHAGEVRTAELTATAVRPGAAPAAAPAVPAPSEHDDSPHDH
jgi:hypothetical protein